MSSKTAVLIRSKPPFVSFMDSLLCKAHKQRKLSIPGSVCQALWKLLQQLAVPSRHIDGKNERVWMGLPWDTSF